MIQFAGLLCLAESGQGCPVGDTRRSEGSQSAQQYPTSVIHLILFDIVEKETAAGQGTGYRRFNISYVETINEKDVKITTAGPLFRVTAKYESRVHLFGNVYVVMAFYKQVQVRRS